MKQVTLMAPVGVKLNASEELISLYHQECQFLIRKKLIFPCYLEQIHGVVIGLERIPNRNGFLNKNIWEESGHELPMLFPKLFEIILSYFPIKIRFGGLNKYYAKFLSHDETPFNRSFQINMTSGKVVLIGWPYNSTNYYTQSLWKMRNEIDKYCNIRHKYANYQDNDFSYFESDYWSSKPVVFPDIPGARHSFRKSHQIPFSNIYRRSAVRGHDDLTFKKIDC
jgi:hypothetical protein